MSRNGSGEHHHVAYCGAEIPKGSTLEPACFLHFDLAQSLLLDSSSSCLILLFYKPLSFLICLLASLFESSGLD